MALTTVQAGIIGNSQAGPGAAMNTNVAIVETNALISNSYSITTGTNAHSVGPVTIASGITVTIPLGSVWSIT